MSFKHNIVGSAVDWFFVSKQSNLNKDKLIFPLCLWGQDENGKIYGLISDTLKNQAGLLGVPPINGTYKHLLELSDEDLKIIKCRFNYELNAN